MFFQAQKPSVSEQDHNIIYYFHISSHSSQKIHHLVMSKDSSGTLKNEANIL